MSNADKISHHLCAKALQQQYGLKVVSPCLTKEGELALDLGEQGFWRAISYLPHSHSIEVVKSEKEAENGRQGLWTFCSALSDFDATQLEDVIPQFHHLPGRMALLNKRLNSIANIA